MSEQVQLSVIVRTILEDPATTVKREEVPVTVQVSFPPTHPLPRVIAALKNMYTSEGLCVRVRFYAKDADIATAKALTLEEDMRFGWMPTKDPFYNSASAPAPPVHVPLFPVSAYSSGAADATPEADADIYARNPFMKYSSRSAASADIPDSTFALTLSQKQVQIVVIREKLPPITLFAGGREKPIFANIGEFTDVLPSQDVAADEAPAAFQFMKSNNCVGAGDRWDLREYISNKIKEDFLLAHMDASTPSDGKSILTRASLAAIIGEQSVQRLFELFADRVDSIILRRTDMIGNGIPMHTDHAVKTLQLCLSHSDEKTGGQLVFAGSPPLVREPGAITIHDNTAKHMVTPLLDGTRYGLYLLKNPDE